MDALADTGHGHLSSTSIHILAVTKTVCGHVDVMVAVTWHILGTRCHHPPVSNYAACMNAAVCLASGSRCREAESLDTQSFDIDSMCLGSRNQL